MKKAAHRAAFFFTRLPWERSDDRWGDDAFIIHHEPARWIGKARPTLRKLGEIRFAPLHERRQRLDGLRRAQALAKQRALLFDHLAQLLAAWGTHQALAVGYRRRRQLEEAQGHLTGLGQGALTILQRRAGNAPLGRLGTA